jgi:endonuclease YncB( thermonuclease family)
MQFYYFDSPHKQITESFNARVVRVIDGDTIEVKMEERNFTFPVRMNIIDAPEMKEGMRGLESKRWLENQILNEEVEILINPKQPTEKFGRIIGNVLKGGEDIGEKSLNEGMSFIFGIERPGEIPGVKLWL